ncbi:hypothetical protein AK830_g3715 [Neonectria ditissima]|uniref:Beta-lactamase-related domain-containing protein n=1 Tax=Neonectria ditissima TaxID=78410 RepID=A0A0P7BN44_9HYPO|nr:hypothetical protein AK830_g3715 [Neonectria ditissima]
MIGRTAGFLDQTREGWNTPLRFRPGESWQYGSGIDWAGQVLETVTGQSLGSYMSENIFKPLGMSDTTFRPAAQDFFSTPQDYIKFLQAVLAAGEGQGTLLRKQSVEEMFRPQLNEAQSTKMKTWLGGALPFQGQTPVNHGISGAINMGNIEGKRRKGTLTWAGISNPQWWIDREAGIAAVLFVNILPPDDEPVKRMYDDSWGNSEKFTLQTSSAPTVGEDSQARAGMIKQAEAVVSTE